MKILIGMPSPDSWGGPIASEPPFVEGLKELGHEVATEVYVYGDKERPTPFFSRIKRVVRTAFRFRKLTAHNDFDVIHLNSAFDLRTILRDSFSLFLMRPGKAKIFVKLHGSMAEDFVDSGFFVRCLMGYLRRRVDAFGYHSRVELKSFLKLGFDGAKFFPVKNAVTVHLDLPAGFERRQKDTDAIFELLFVSRFVPAKGLLETIEACDELRRRGIKFRLTCVGDGPSRRSGEDAVGRLGLGRVVKFTGHVPEEEVKKLLLSADIFLFPTSHPEGFPNILFKAVALGLPIVTTRIRAAADYLSEPENALFCERSAGSVAERVAELIGNKKMREEMAANNLAYAVQLSPEVVAGEFEEIYFKMVV